MKKFIIISCAIAAISTLFSCEKAEAPKSGLFEITVGSDESKTNFNGTAIHWNIGDKISLFHAVSESSSYVNDGAFTATADDAVTTFTGILSETLTASNYDWYAVYPYTAETTGPDWVKGVIWRQGASDRGLLPSIWQHNQYCKGIETVHYNASDGISS